MAVYFSAGLPGAYAPPDGRLLLAWCDDEAAGCVGLRSLGAVFMELPLKKGPRQQT